MNHIRQNLERVQGQIADAAARAGRNVDEITLIAVSKTFPTEAIRAAYDAGIRHFGENRVEEAAEKIPAINAHGVTWHLVGHLQSRKAKDAAALFDFIHSIDSVSLAKKLDDRAATIGKRIPVLLEVNIAGEESKFGFAPRGDFFDAVREILTCTNLETQGLMTVAPIGATPDDARPYFRALRELRDELRKQFSNRAWPHLSMGMTDDFSTAIAEGATMIRIGRAIFGERT